MVTTIIVGLAIVVLIVLGIAATRSPIMRVERYATIPAPAEKIFPLINNLREWQAWSPWERLDPALKRKYGGAEAGKGATYEWEGNKQAGKGRMQVVESVEPRSIVLDLHFLKPWESRGRIEFLLRPTEAGTEVVWTMESPRTFMTKLVCVFINMERMVGRDFESGLARLREVVTGASQSPARNSSVT